MHATRILDGLTDHDGDTVFDSLWRASGRPEVRAALAWLLVALAVLALSGAFMAVASAGAGTAV